MNDFVARDLRGILQKPENSLRVPKTKAGALGRSPGGRSPSTRRRAAGGSGSTTAGPQHRMGQDPGPNPRLKFKLPDGSQSKVPGERAPSAMSESLE